MGIFPQKRFIYPEFQLCNSNFNIFKGLLKGLGSRLSFTRMESAFLSQIVEMGSQEALVKALKEAADPEDVERITKDNADSMVLLGKNLPSEYGVFNDSSIY